MQAIWTGITTAVTNIVELALSVFTSIGTALETNVLLQILFGIAMVSVAFLLIRKVVNLIKSFK